VAIIHDTIPWNSNCGQSEAVSKTGRVLDFLAFARCEQIVTISHSSSRDLNQLWPSLSKKTTVIQNGVDESYLASAYSPLSPHLKKLGVREPYFLYCGGNIARKRPSWAIQAFTELNSKNAQLVMCGLNQQDTGTLLYSTPSHIQQRIVIPGFVCESDMIGLYRQALGVLYPTLYEGFGLPAIESQACGTACLLSPVSSLSELIGPGVRPLPQNNLSAWVRCMEELEKSGGLSAEQASAAHSWAADFEWSKSAKRYLSLFSAIAR
jgi:alpha-1,3-rhamnosyl/mannosyltransferase